MDYLFSAVIDKTHPSLLHRFQYMYWYTNYIKQKCTIQIMLDNKKYQTFPVDFKDVFFAKLPLKTSQIRQPSDHISVDLQSQKNKTKNI